MSFSPSSGINGQVAGFDNYEQGQQTPAKPSSREAIIEQCAQIADKHWAREVASQIRALALSSTHRGSE